MEKKVYFGVAWYTYCVNGSRSYYREFDLRSDAAEKYAQVVRKQNVYCARITERVRVFENGVHVQTICRIIEQFDKISIYD